MAARFCQAKTRRTRNRSRKSIRKAAPARGISEPQQLKTASPEEILHFVQNDGACATGAREGVILSEAKNLPPASYATHHRHPLFWAPSANGAKQTSPVRRTGRPAGPWGVRARPSVPTEKGRGASNTRPALPDSSPDVRVPGVIPLSSAPYTY